MNEDFYIVHKPEEGIINLFLKRIFFRSLLAKGVLITHLISLSVLDNHFFHSKKF